MVNETILIRGGNLMGNYSKTRELVAMGLFTALTCIAGLLSKWVVIFGVPISFLPMMALLAGMLLGSRAGAISMIAYLIMGLIGIPVFSVPPYGGPMYVFVPTFGFIIGFILCAWVVGKIMEKQSEPSTWRYGLAVLAGVICYNSIGLPYFWLMKNFYIGDTISMVTVFNRVLLPFIGLDLIKAVVASMFAKAVSRRVQLAVHNPG